MKTKLTLIALLLLAATYLLQLDAAVSANAPPIYEIIIQTNPTNTLTATSIRGTPSTWYIDGTTHKPVLLLNVEPRDLEVDGNGKTNLITGMSRTLEIKGAVLGNWLQAPNNASFYENALLNKVNLTKKP